MDVYIIVAHSPHSPGGVWGERNEYSDSLRFSLLLKKELREKKGVDVKILYSREYDSIPENALVLSFHRDGNMKNCESKGAKAFVSESASAKTQYDAYRLLESITGEKGFCYKGVHTNGKKAGFKRILEKNPLSSFVFTLGFMDMESDNAFFDKNISSLAKAFSLKLYEIIKERENETDTPFFRSSRRGEQFEDTGNCA